MSARRGGQSESSEDEYFSVGAHGLGAGEETSDDDEADTDSMAPPRHPLPSMQGAFEESIYESTAPTSLQKDKESSAESRRQQMLETRHYDDSWTTRWKQKPSARHHPLAKLMAQIIFGMHLLQQQAAKSDEEVVKILQTHVDEVDNFLEKTTDDFDLAIKDIGERIHFLKLPMQHPDVFSKMLEDKQFRTQLMEGNDKIENIIERTSRAMNAALLDVQKGKAATKELGKYLNTVADEWPGEKQDLEAVLTAMRGNEQGWKHCFKDLQKKGVELRDNLDQLTTVIGEMARMAADASRRTRAHGRAASQQPQMSAIPRSKFSSDGQRARAMSVDKPLPKAPPYTGEAVELEAHPVPLERRYEQPRPTPASPSMTAKTPASPASTVRAARSSTVPPRPSTSSSMTPREPRSSSGTTADIVEFLKEGQTLPSANNASDATSGHARKRSSAIDVVDHARTISRNGSRRPSTSDGANVLTNGRRGSEPRRVTSPPPRGIDRNRHGPPPTRESARSPPPRGIDRNKDGPPPTRRRGSSVSRIMRRLSLSRDKSPAPSVREISQPDPASPSSVAGPFPTRPPTSQSTRAPDTSSPPTTKPQTATDAPLQPTVSPRLSVPALQQSQPQPPEAPSTPSAASAQSTTASPNTTATPATENLSPATKTASAEKRPGPKPVNGSNASTASVNGVSKESVPLQQQQEKQSRGLSLRRLFGGGKSKGPKERIPRSRMTYGDLP